LDETEFIPAVGQGCVAIEAFKSLDSQKRISIRRSINHQQTEQTLLAERAYLAELDGGCSIPIFALAKYDGSQIKLTGGIISLDGTDRVIDEVKGAHPITLGKSLATKILNAGGVKILEEIKRQI
jgi:hydroxymethylbilane synthase